MILVATDAPRHDSALSVTIMRRIANRTDERRSAVTLARVDTGFTASAHKRRIEPELLRQPCVAQLLLARVERHNRQLDALLDDAEFALFAEKGFAPAAGETVATAGDETCRWQTDGADVVGKHKGILQLDDGLV